MFTIMENDPVYEGAIAYYRDGEDDPIAICIGDPTNPLDWAIKNEPGGLIRSNIDQITNTLTVLYKEWIKLGGLLS